MATDTDTSSVPTNSQGTDAPTPVTSLANDGTSRHEEEKDALGFGWDGSACLPAAFTASASSSASPPSSQHCQKKRKVDDTELDPRLMGYVYLPSRRPAPLDHLLTDIITESARRRGVSKSSQSARSTTSPAPTFSSPCRLSNLTFASPSPSAPNCRVPRTESTRKSLPSPVVNGQGPLATATFWYALYCHFFLGTNFLRRTFD